MSRDIIIDEKVSIWKPSLLKGSVLSKEEQAFKDILCKLNKISPENFERLSGEILEIELLSDLGDDSPRQKTTDFDPEDIEKMEKVVELFINATCNIRNTGQGGSEMQEILAKLFIKLKDKWDGRQGRILATVMTKYIANYFSKYFDNSLTFIEKIKCENIMYFTGLLYEKGMFDTRFCMVALMKFKIKDESNIRVFCNLLNACYKKLKNEKLFTSNKEKFVSFLNECVSDRSIPGLVRNMCMDSLEAMNL